jgi:protein SCO1/2
MPDTRTFFILRDAPVAMEIRRRRACFTLLFALCLLVPNARLAALSAADFAPSAQSSLMFRDDLGRETRLAQFHGRPIVLTMAYTTCRRVCPTTMVRLGQMQRELEARGRIVEFVIVGYDPDGDDPAAWHQYRLHNGLQRENWHFLTGTRTSVAQFAQTFGFEFWKYDQHVMHDRRIVVLDRNGTLVAADERESASALLAVLDQPDNSATPGR